jgi:hypothetical protein
MNIIPFVNTQVALQNTDLNGMPVWMQVLLWGMIGASCLICIWILIDSSGG